MGSFINVIFLSLNVYLVSAKSTDKLFMLQNPQSPPQPSPDASKCFISIGQQLDTCRSEAISHWNITEKSPQRDICCAEWEIIACALIAAQANCPQEEFIDVQKYINDLTDYLDQTSCRQYPKGTSQCTLLALPEEIFDERPPLPKPTVVDCFTQFSRAVVRTCAVEARIKWNVTRRAPIRNKCCALWYDIDCLDEVVRIRCPSVEVTDTEDYFKQVEDWAAKGACNASTYHSKACTQEYIQYEKDIETELKPYIPQPNPRSEITDIEQSRQESTQFYFLLNYLNTAFPQLLHMMIILAIILIAIVVIQCVIITRQVKQDTMIAEIMPSYQYRKI